MTRLGIVLAGAIAVLACACQLETAAPQARAAPPAVNGLYAAEGACPFEGCALRPWRARAQVDLYARADPAAPIVGKLAVGERVTAVDSVQFLAPRRGVVVGAFPGFARGDVVYLLDHQAEGVYNLWRRGEIASWTDDGSADETDPHIRAGIRWDIPVNDWNAEAAKEKAAGAIWWVRVERDGAGASGGWLRDPHDFDCMGMIDAPPDCLPPSAGAP